MTRFDLSPEVKQPIVEATLRAFLSADYKEAIRIALDYLNKCGRGPTSMGGGMVMGGPPPAQLLAYLATIRPTILSSVPPEIVETMRREAALEELLGEENKTEWKPEENFVSFKRRFARGMLRFAASYQYNLLVYSQSGVSQVQILCGGMDWLPTQREYTCLVCRPLHNTVYPIGEVPELPHPPCIGYYGCRCRYSPIFER